MYDLYETRYGIFDHRKSGKKRPWASVALHESEDICETSSLTEAIENYHGRGIKELFGLSVVEYLNLPSDVCLTLMIIANREAAKKSVLANKMVSELAKK